MKQARRRARGAPLLVLAASLIAVISFPAVMQAGPPPARTSTQPAACLPLSANDIAMAARSAPRGLARRVSVGERVSASGEFLGRQLSIDSVAGGPARVSLPADSFAGPLVGSLMLFGGETEEGSQVSAIDVAAGCATTLIGSADVIRGATISRDGAALYFHSVTQRRRDLGVRRLDIASGGVEQVIGPIEADAAYGVTFATVLAWSEDGGSLAVQSCAIERCRTRVLDTATGELALYAGDGHGALVGLDAARLYVFDDCHTRPCALLAIERDGGATSVVADEAFHAEMASQAGLTRLLIETAAGVEEVTP